MSPGELRAHHTEILGLKSKSACVWGERVKNVPFCIFSILEELLMDYDQTERPPSQGIILFVIKIE